MCGTTCGEKTGREGIPWAASFCTLLFQLNMLLSLAHLIPTFKAHFKFKLSLEVFDPLPGHR